MEEATVAAWLVVEGATVAPGDEIAEIETSKIANVLEAPAGGVLVRQVANPGEVRPVGALIAVIADAGEDAVAVSAFIAGQAAQAAADTRPAPPQPVSMEIDGEPFRYLRLGPPDGAPSARPVVLVHGFGGDHGNWQFIQAVLAEHRPVYAVDLPGHGGSTKQVGDGSLKILATRVAAWMDTIGRGRVHLVGHSMGAAVAAALALDRLDRVKSLVAINGVGFGGTLNREYVDGFLKAERRTELKPVVDLLFADPALVTRQMLDDLVAARRIDGAAEALRTLADGALGCESIARLARRIPDLTLPVMHMVGDRDRVVTGSQPQDAMLFPAGHMPHLEASSAVAAEISKFLMLHD